MVLGPLAPAIREQGSLRNPCRVNALMGDTLWVPFEGSCEM